MKPEWHAVSTVLLEEPRCFAMPTMLRLLAMAGPTTLIYVGDSMWPTCEPECRLTIEPGSEAARGDVVAYAASDGTVQIGRVVDGPQIGSALPSGRNLQREVRVIADAEAGAPVSVASKAILGRVPDLAGQPASKLQRLLRRLICDLKETGHRPDRVRPDRTQSDPAESVRAKYDAQAPHYLALAAAAIPSPVLDRLTQAWKPKGRVLVVGSGVGRECIELAQRGWSIHGVDFSEPMVRLARKRLEEEAADIRARIEYEGADVRSMSASEPYDGIFFTFDVYSFLPTAQDRLGVLAALRQMLAADGRLFLSARCVSSGYSRSIHTWAWIRRGFRDPWGSSHTRWVDDRGALNRSFVQVFPRRRIRREASRAGWRSGNWSDGYCELAPLES